MYFLTYCKLYFTHLFCLLSVSTKNVSSIRKEIFLKIISTFLCLVYWIIVEGKLLFCKHFILLIIFHSSVDSKSGLNTQLIFQVSEFLIPSSCAKVIPFSGYVENKESTGFKLAFFLNHKGRQDHLHNHEISDKMEIGILSHSESIKDFKTVTAEH